MNPGIRHTQFQDEAGTLLGEREPLLFTRLWAPGDRFRRYGRDYRIVAVRLDLATKTQHVTLSSWTEVPA